MLDDQVTRRTVMATGAAGVLAGVVGANSASAAPAAGTAADRAVKGWVTATMARMSLQDKVNQLFVIYVYGATPDVADARNTPLYGVQRPIDVIAKYQPGGVIYFNWTDSAQNPEQIRVLSNGLQAAALKASGKLAIPLTISTDQEQGVVTRVGPPATQFPGNMALGAGRSAADATTAAQITGQELRAMGINTNFAPDADVNVNPLNPVIGTRSFSSEPDLVAEMVTAQVRGYQRRDGVSSSAKHFPGHGDTATDSHVAFPIITHTKEQWEQIDAPPFRAAIAAGIDMVMTAHLNMPALDDSGDPATLSKPILTGLLRDELGFDGVVITDSLEMQGVRDLYGDAEVAVRALEAGVDQLLMTPAPDAARAAVMEAIASGRLSRAFIDAKVRRILTLKYNRGIVANPYASAAAMAGVVGTAAHLRAADAVTNRTTTLIRNDDNVLPFAASGKKVLVAGYGVTTTQTLATGLTAAGASATIKSTGTAPSDAAIADAVAAAAGHDLIVVTTMKAWDTSVTDPKAGQQRLVAELIKTGVPVVVAAVRDPYDVAYLPDAKTYLATYSYSPVAIDALARVITGAVSPSGTLPVDIPVAGDPSTVLYPFGFGLTY